MDMDSQPPPVSEIQTIDPLYLIINKLNHTYTTINLTSGTIS